MKVTFRATRMFVDGQPRAENSIRSSAFDRTIRAYTYTRRAMYIRARACMCVLLSKKFSTRLPSLNETYSGNWDKTRCGR